MSTRGHRPSSSPLVPTWAVVPLPGHGHWHTNITWFLHLKKKITWPHSPVSSSPFASFLSNPLQQTPWTSRLNSYLQCLASHSLQSGLHILQSHSNKGHKWQTLWSVFSLILLDTISPASLKYLPHLTSRAAHSPGSPFHSFLSSYTVSYTTAQILIAQWGLKHDLQYIYMYIYILS